MRITLGVTDNDWAAYLRTRENVYEVNFWVPSGRSFMGRASADEPFLFKTKMPTNRIVGGGFYVGFWELRVSEAWAMFEEGNGVASEADLAAAIAKYRARNKAPYEPDPTIGCTILRNPFFARPGEELPPPERWGVNIVQGKTYDESDPDFEYVDHAFRALQGEARVDYRWDRDLVGVDLDSDRYGAPMLTRPRLGQSTFRLALRDAYANRCAITGSGMYPALEAAHIRPYAQGGHHVLSNGLLLRSDMHTLYDQGYVGVDPSYRLRVSPRLRVETGNGIALYQQELRGDVIQLPAREQDRPSREALEWHMDEVFRSAS